MNKHTGPSLFTREGDRIPPDSLFWKLRDFSKDPTNPKYSDISISFYKSLEDTKFASDIEAVKAHLSTVKQLNEQVSLVYAVNIKKLETIIAEFERQVNVIAQGKAPKRKDFSNVENELNQKLEPIRLSMHKAHLAIAPLQPNGPYRSSYKEPPFEFETIYLPASEDSNVQRKIHIPDDIRSFLKHYDLGEEERLDVEVAIDSLKRLVKKTNDTAKDLSTFLQMAPDASHYVTQEVKDLSVKKRQVMTYPSK